ncbi:MAG: ParB/RepB/Spo0J family partition protein [Rhodovibrionaceae bacterium]|nr:ParB/RepB/Spo0J family partition protein [Rhodovibrionaceae bacterium]
MTDVKRKNLGRGIAALLGDDDDYGSSEGAQAKRTAPIEHLHPNAKQPRRHFDEESIRQLSDSIKSKGILQPILVRPHPSRQGEFEIVAGERRWRAAQLAQLHEVPIIETALDDRQALEVALVENVQRQDLNPLEEAEGYKRLMEEFGHSQEDLGRIISKSRSHIANTLRLLNLDDEVKSLVDDGKLSAGHARALLNAAEPASIARKAVSQGLSVREVEKLAQAGRAPDARAGGRKAKSGAAPKTGSAAKSQDKDSDTLALERDLSALLGLKVTIDFRSDGAERQAGAITIHYETLEQLDDVLHRLHQSKTSSQN